MAAKEKLSDFYRRLDEMYQLSGVLSLQRWDQSVCMPAGGARGRASQIECLSRLLHQRRIDPALGELVDRLSESGEEIGEEHAINVREVKRQLDRDRSLPNSFVAEYARLRSESYSAWTEARKNDDFAAIQPYLEKLFSFAREEAELVGYKAHPYDALLDKYEPYCTLAEVKPLFQTLADALSDMVPRIIDAQPAEREPSLAAPAAVQYACCRRVAEDLGYSFETGRLDPTAHPFETSIGPGDVRVTTRYDESNLLSGLYSTIHEVGHALYELGLPQNRLGTPLGTSVSLGIHESQSRLWENIIGRSYPFCEYLSGILREKLPAARAASSPQALWQLVNRVSPSLIRVEADEVTYSLHVIIRTQLEERLIEGSLAVDSLPEAWNELYNRCLGIMPPSFRDGVLQDVHWFHGGIGYFPTYALGNFYSAAFFEKLRVDLPDAEDWIGRGEFEPLRTWLTENIHQHGRRFRATDLIVKSSGRRLSAEPFIEYLQRKFNLDGRQGGER